MFNLKNIKCQPEHFSRIEEENSGISKFLLFQVFPHLVPIVLPLAQISLTSSVYTIVALAIERFLAVNW
jgi:hypothetical protein